MRQYIGAPKEGCTNALCANSIGEPMPPCATSIDEQKININVRISKGKAGGIIRCANNIGK